MHRTGEEEDNATIVSPPTRSTRRIARGGSRVPEDSVFYNRVVPILLAGMAVLTVLLILVAAGYCWALCLSNE